MREYVGKIFNYAFRGFAIRADLVYALVSIGVAGTTGSKDKPVGALTPWEIAWYVIIFMVTYAAIRILLVAPYRLWQEQCSQIAGLNAEIARPERIGSDELHKIRAQKRLDLASEINNLGWLCYSESVPGRIEKLDACYEKSIRLVGEANPSQDFLMVYSAYQIETQKLLSKDRDADAILARSAPLKIVMLDYLLGKATDDGLTEALKKFMESK